MRKYARGGLTQVIKEIANSDYALLIDDFHYVAQGIQVELMRQIKEVIRNNVKMCVASVMHRADHAIRANQEMQGRISVIDLKYWGRDELRKV